MREWVSCPHPWACGAERHIAGGQAQRRCQLIGAQQRRNKSQQKSTPFAVMNPGQLSVNLLHANPSNQSGPIIIHQESCSCKSCRSGSRTPVDELTHEDMQGMISGRKVWNLSGHELVCDWSQSGEATTVRLGSVEAVIPTAELPDQQHLITAWDAVA